MYPIDDIIAYVHGVGIFRKHIYLKSIDITCSLKSLIPPAGALQQGRADRLRGGRIQVINDRLYRFATRSRRVFFLEAVLAPVYYMHRYQTEAAAKLIGGLDYRYALRGDGQYTTKLLPPQVQLEALESVLKTISPEVLSLPERIISILPPRPMGYSRSRELAPLRSSLTFDPLSAAESAAGLTTTLLFHPARAQRLLEYHARDKSQPGFALVLDRVINQTIKAKPKPGLDGEVQRVIGDVVLNALMQLARNGDAGSEVQALSLLRLKELEEWSRRSYPSLSDELQKAHLYRISIRIAEFMEKPADITLRKPLSPPDGPPIGSACN